MPSSIPGRIATQVRIDETVWKKVKVIAQQESRNANSQLNYFLQQAVAAYEQQHGEVKITD